ncbi:MAG: GH1 family beta-glucosidase [Gaiellaceae bacterium]
MKDERFPPGFVWGAAMSAYQVEGAIDEDGRGESIWDRFSAEPGRVRAGDTGAIASDFYHRYRGDVALARELGLNGLRFSVAWPRILPEGRGRVNPAGLDFYDRLVEELLAAGIEPFATLYHWDLPQLLEDAGGWPTRATVDAFCEYAEAVVGRLGDRVRNWVTVNEPWVPAWQGYGVGLSGDGAHAPGRDSRKDALAAAHNLLLAHGRAVEIVRRDAPGAKVGITLNLAPNYPASESAEDVAAARESDGTGNRWFLDPVYRGVYPPDVVELYADDLPVVAAGDMDVISAATDFLGVNYYFPLRIKALASGGLAQVRRPGATITDMGEPWEVEPQGLVDLLLRLRDDYRPEAIHITENGAAFSDEQAHDGSVKDPERTAYLAGHVDAVARAIEQGAPVAGYFAWSLLDNFEWAHGYSKRFGLVYVHYPTLERIPKSSFHWYREFIAAQRAES